jgi:cytochrome c553
MQRMIGLAVLAVVLAFPSIGSGAEATLLDSPGASKSMVCSACHGFGGNSPGNTMPIIAGMAPNYFKKAIKDYAEGKRPSPEMEPYSKYVQQAGLDEIAAYFAAQKKQPTRIKLNPQAAKRGAALAAQCTTCHSPQAESDPEKAFPVLRGQPPGYLTTQLLILKEDKRKLDDAALDDLKKKMLKPLSEQELADLAAYFSSLR